jgi:hypothetical protein
MLETLLTSLFVALSSVALAVILRNAPIIRTWVFEMKKPWACNVCLPLYTCAAVVGALFYQNRDLHVLWSYLPSYALVFLTLEAMARPPLILPDFGGGDE